MRILIVKLSSIGDVIHTLPTLAAIKKSLPDAEISWVVENRSAEILRNNPLLDELIEIDTKALRSKNLFGGKLKSAQKQFKNLRENKFDLTIDFQGLLKSASMAKISKAKKRYGFSKQNLREPASRIFLSKTIDVELKQNIIYKNLQLAEKSLQHFLNDKNFKLDKENPEFSIATDETHKQEAEKIIEQTGENFAILNPAGGWVTKLWHTEKYGELADKLWNDLQMVSVISTAPNEIDLAKKVLENSKSGKTISAQPTLKGFYELAKQTKIYIGGDTAPTFLAVAGKCPVVGIFGPTEWWRNGSINPDDICVERNDINCRIDCHRRTCDKWICMDISVETVFDAIVKRLK
ncbi:MAG: lipopolysaccharide heptosyltransferase I [Acidobacteriota bacterium]|nr:lipopolysaccharide heptosyltransferase I [Acidobacteriota bacterium]